jgi:CRISPR/Cas system CMR subunit Cmr4 (Cas7 group RAMP superfamily)
MATRSDRIHIAYDLTFATPFHCGTGIRVGLIDRTIVRDSEGYLYVPGSTFKGVLRERCEQLARLYEELDENMLDLIASPHDEAVALQGLGQTITMITRIFGSHNHPGHLFFDDARQVEENQQQSESDESDVERGYSDLQTQLYTQVRIDRPTRTAIKGALYTSEFGIRNLTFKGNITGWLTCRTTGSSEDDGPTYSLLLLLAGLQMIDRLGGNKSTGKGRCTCKTTLLKIGTKEYTPEQWQSWLERLGELSYYSTSQEEEA